MKFDVKKYTLRFKFDAGTSRGVLTERDVWLIKVYEADRPELFGIGECAPLRGLSIDDAPDIEQRIADLGKTLVPRLPNLTAEEALKAVSEVIPASLPSVRFGFETAALDYLNGGRRLIFENDFFSGRKSIPINGLIWMGDKIFMVKQAREKLQQGFNCIKVKIGALDFQEECELLDFIRVQYSLKDISLRLDANGAFHPDEALEKLNILKGFEVHSIEQPIKAGQWDAMERICALSPIPVALDEELIGVYDFNEKEELLNKIKPQYIILKPSLLGGIKATKEWLEIAESMSIGWWITSALESNIGLNAIAQFTAGYAGDMAQGLGTGQLYHNNILSPLVIREGKLMYDANKSWDINIF